MSKARRAALIDWAETVPIEFPTPLPATFAEVKVESGLTFPTSHWQLISFLVYRKTNIMELISHCEYKNGAEDARTRLRFRAHNLVTAECKRLYDWPEERSNV